MGGMADASDRQSQLRDCLHPTSSPARVSCPCEGRDGRPHPSCIGLTSVHFLSAVGSGSSRLLHLVTPLASPLGVAHLSPVGVNSILCGLFLLKCLRVLAISGKGHHAWRSLWGTLTPPPPSVQPAVRPQHTGPAGVLL